MRSARLLVFLPVLTLASTLAAQTTTRVVPPNLANTFRNWPEPAPFEQGPTRMQQIVDGNAFCNVTAQITSIAFRGGDVTYAQAGQPLQNLQVTIGYAATTPKTMSLTWASNLQGTQTTVLSGSYNLPNLYPTDPASKFPVEFKLPKPFLYIRAKGPLLIDIQNGDTYLLKRYTLDADDLGNRASRTNFGVCGLFPQTNRCMQFTVDPLKTQLRLGGNVAFEIDDVPQLWPALLVLGASNTNFLGLNLPYDLSLIGAAKGNFLNVSLDVPIPIALVLKNPRGGSYGASVSVPIPNSKSLTGATFHAQCLVAGGGGAVPLTASEGWTLKLPNDSDLMQMVFGFLNSQSGFYFSGSRVVNQPMFLGGLVVRLGGTFN